MRYPRNYSLNLTSSYAPKFYILLPCVMFSFTTMLKHNSHHRPCPPTTPFPMFTSNRPYPVLFSHSEPAPSCLHSCLHACLRACSISLWTTSTSCTSRSSATKRSSSSPLNFFATSTTILTRFNHDNFFYKNTN